MGDERLRVRTRGAITEIEFDHPPINVYDVATRDALCEVLTAVIADPGVRVVVFTATGEHFSADVSWLTAFNIRRPEPA